MRRTTFWLAVVAVFLALGVPLAGQQPSPAPVTSERAKATATKETPKKTTKKTTKKKTTAAAANKKTTAAKATAATATKKTTKKTKTTTTDKTAKTAKPVKRAKKETTKINPMTKTAAVTPASHAAVGSTGSAPGPWRPNNPVAEELSKRTTEVTRVRRVLSAGADLNAATSGFRNYSHFAGAINASEHKGLDFWKLRSLMTGVNADGSRTNMPTMSLGLAVQTLNGTATTPPAGSF